MRHLIIILLHCLGISFGLLMNLDLCGDKDLTVRLGGSMDFYFDGMSSRRKMLDMSVEINNKTYKLYPGLEMPDTSVQYVASRMRVLINSATFDHAGKWTFIRTIEKTKRSKIDGNVTEKPSIFIHTNSCEVIIQEQVNSLPSNYIYVQDPSNVKLYLDGGFDDVTDCQLIKRVYEQRENYINMSLSQPIENAKFDKDCGVTMEVEVGSTGFYELLQFSGKYKIKNIFFYLQVEIPWLNKVAKKQVTWIRGSKRNISVPVPSVYEHSSQIRHDFCQWSVPNGEIVNINQRNCNYEVERVSKAHAGVWTARFRVSHQMQLREAEIEVNVEDPLDDVQTSVNVSESSITLMCRTKYLNFDFCLFKSPNGTTINLPQGISTSKYEYYGGGYSSHYGGPYISLPRNLNYNPHPDKDPLYSECGLKIKNPSPEDNGAWMCMMGWDIVPSITSSYLLVNSNSTELLDITAEDVFVKEGDHFTVKCTVKARLNYCLIQNPAGESYLHRKEDDLHNVLRNPDELYDRPVQNLLGNVVSSELDVGKCEIFIEKSEKIRDTGDWSCKLGIGHLGQQIEKKFHVEVRGDSSESSLIHRMNMSKDILELSCHLAPGMDDTIKYCRWECSRYLPGAGDISYFSNSTTCIYKVNKALPGNSNEPCTCIAGLIVDSAFEIFATF